MVFPRTSSAWQVRCLAAPTQGFRGLFTLASASLAVTLGLLHSSAGIYGPGRSAFEALEATLSVRISQLFLQKQMWHCHVVGAGTTLDGTVDAAVRVTAMRAQGTESKSQVRRRRQAQTSRVHVADASQACTCRLPACVLQPPPRHDR